MNTTTTRPARRTFLEYVAEDLLAKYGCDLSRTAVVFPNKRASLFLGEALVRLADRPVWSPRYITISDLFRRHSSLCVADQLKLISDLHKTFCKCTGSRETLDHFWGWGQLLLADFDDIDKNMADAGKVFANLQDLHDYDDDSFLTEEQKGALRRFFHLFGDGADTELKRRFAELWSHFHDIYREYGALLRSQGLAYEGALYRSVAEDGDIAFEYDRYVFVGFNMLQRAEQRLFSRLKAEGRAVFYWDFDRYYMPDGRRGPGGAPSEAGHYIAQYLEAFPNELDTSDEHIYNNMSEDKRITFIEAATENVQARYVAQWLRAEGRLAAGRHTAVVMCDESILQPVLHSLPEETDRVNVTTGFPLSQTPVASLVMQLLDMQTLGHRRASARYNMRYVERVLRHPYAKYISGRSVALLEDLTGSHIYFPSREQMSRDEGTAMIAADLASYAMEEDGGLGESSRYNLLLLRWMSGLTRRIGTAAGGGEDALLEESVFRTYTILSRLESLTSAGDLDVDVTTLRRLLQQLIDTTSVPFHGEPAVGLQVMGVLETRGLDFDHVLLLSCGEGNLPGCVNDASFIPYSIRKAYGLTTVDHKVAIYSYYFHRLLQRARDVTIAYNGSTTDGHVGEMSRFMTQLLVEGPHRIERLTAHTPGLTAGGRRAEIEKDAAVMARLTHLGYISPTAINCYIRCPLKFFYRYMAGMNEPDGVGGEIDGRMFGNIFHRAAELAYRPFAVEGGREVTAEDIDRLTGTRGCMERLVDEAFDDEFFKTDGGRRPEYNGLQIINREVIIGYLRELLMTDRRLTPFRILSLEQRVETEIPVRVAGRADARVRIGGKIDRMDVVGSGAEARIRIVDYKTGGRPNVKLDTLEDVFSAACIGKHSDNFLQAMLYALIVGDSERWNGEHLQVSPALLFIRQKAAEDFDPTLVIGGHPVRDAEVYREGYMGLLGGVLSEMFDACMPFRPTQETGACEGCAFRGVCQL